MNLPRPPRLTLRFALYAGAALALAGGASVWVAGERATVQAQRDVWDDARFIAERLGSDDLARSSVQQVAFGDVRAQLDEVFDRDALGPRASRVTIFRRDGRVTYATDHRLIGTVHPDGRLLEDALSGMPVYRVAEVGGRKLLESYVPVRWVLADPTWSAGVLRVSRDYAPVQQEIRDDVRIQAATILLALVFLYLALFPILRRVTNDLKARNRSLAVSEARWRALAEQASDAIFAVDGDGVVLQVNERACRLLGRLQEEVVGRSFGDFVDEDELARVPLRLEELRAGMTILHERRLVRADGTRLTAELSARMLDDGRVLAIVRDVTERNELEEQRRRALRAEATERLAVGIAGDFDDLLAAISAYAEVALGRISPTDGLRHPLDQVRDAAARGAELTRQLVVFGARNDVEPQVIDTAELLARMDERLRRIAGSAIRIVPAVSDDLGCIAADPAEMEEVVATLVLNACEGMPEGGILTISAESVDFTRRKRDRSADARVEPGHYVMLAISDTGAARGRERDRRLGVGLAAAFAVVQRSGGTLGIESEPGVGTTVRIYLPRVEEPAAVLPAGPDGAVHDLRGAETILVAEDEHVVRAVVREMLEERGYTVLEAGSGVEALLVADRHDGPIDLLLTDVVMPDLGGPALAAELATRHPRCGVIYMSGYADTSPEPGLVFLEKPFTHESLARTVRRVLDEARAKAA